MQLKQFLKKVNQSLFPDNILKLFFSYKGVINRTHYITAIIILFKSNTCSLNCPKTFLCCLKKAA